MNISEFGVTFDVTLIYRSRKSLMKKDGTPGGTRTHNILLRSVNGVKFTRKLHLILRLQAKAETGVMCNFATG